MSNQRGQWGSRMGFIMAAIGSAIGLGNIWRFPYVAASNGGGAFLIPYLFALFTAGIPILILEFSLGHRLKTSAPGIFGRIKSKFEVIGWFQTMISFGIIVYYVAIIGWSMNYLVFSLTSEWGTQTKEFFFNNFLNVSKGAFHFEGLNTITLITLVLAWLINYVILRGGVKSGIEKANKIFMPLLIVCLIIITVRGVTLEGASKGLDYFFKPDFTKLTDLKVWIAAYGQIFYSLSICFGIMMTYSSYLPKDTDIVNNAFMTGLGNCSFSIISGIAVFSVLGYMATQAGVGVEEVSAGGIGLAFIVFPKAINALPGFNGLFGAIFFSCLIFAGLSSSMSIMEVVVSGTADKYNISRKKVLNIATLIGFVISLLFVTGAGIHLLDIVDHFINTYAIAVAGLIELIVIAWYINLEKTRNYVNKISDFSVGRWWNVTLTVVTPLLLSIMFLFNAYTDFTQGYGDYTREELLGVGGGTLLLITLFSIIFAKTKGSDDYQNMISKGADL
ncbi:sodium-dependent transporter [Clostridiaceae bacterium M8S5]|nr:sodium-dependent transporter [Clostridiaceae bacterium M8S5]